MQTCNDVILNVTPDDTGAYVACLELADLSRPTVAAAAPSSPTSSGVPLPGTLTVGKNLSVSLGS